MNTQTQNKTNQTVTGTSSVDAQQIGATTEISEIMGSMCRIESPKILESLATAFSVDFKGVYIEYGDNGECTAYYDRETGQIVLDAIRRILGEEVKCNVASRYSRYDKLLELYSGGGKIILSRTYWSFSGYNCGDCYRWPPREYRSEKCKCYDYYTQFCAIDDRGTICVDTSLYDAKERILFPIYTYKVTDLYNMTESEIEKELYYYDLGFEEWYAGSERYVKKISGSEAEKMARDIALELLYELKLIDPSICSSVQQLQVNESIRSILAETFNKAVK